MGIKKKMELAEQKETGLDIQKDCKEKKVIKLIGTVNKRMKTVKDCKCRNEKKVLYCK